MSNIYNYIARDSKYYATKVSQDIVERSEKIERFPESGRIVPELDDFKIREVFIYSYRLMYKISKQSIEVLAVIHFKQDFSLGDFEKVRKFSKS
ncbi:MAG: type II toxin-antitoxin system RelE/ParE family toxin [bacterium]